MPNQNIDLGSTEAVNFNGSEVEKLYLDGALIWEKEDLTTAMSGSDMIGMSFTVSRNPNGSDWPPYPYHQGVSPGQAGYYTYTLRHAHSTYMDSYYQGNDSSGNDGSNWNDQRWHYSRQAYGRGNSIWTGTINTYGYYLYKGPAGNFFGEALNNGPVILWRAPLYAGGPISHNEYLNPMAPVNLNAPYGLDDHHSKFTSAKGTRLLIDSPSVNIPMMEVGATITATKTRANPIGWGNSHNFGYDPYESSKFSDPGYADNAWIICRIA